MYTEQSQVVSESGIQMAAPDDTGPVIVGESSDTTAPKIETENQLEVFSYFPTTVYSIKKPNFLDTVRTVSQEALARRRKDQPK